MIPSRRRLGGVILIVCGPRSKMGLRKYCGRGCVVDGWWRGSRGVVEGRVKLTLSTETLVVAGLCD